MSEDGGRAQSLLAQYDETSARLLAAYGAFEKVYDNQNPLPERTHNSGLGLTNTLTIGASLILVAAAMWVSGSRTIVEFMPVGHPAFVMLEVGSLVYAFRRAMHSEAQEKFSHDLVKAGLSICVAVMLAGNIDATLTEHGVIIPAIIKTIILLAVAVSAPILTFIAGDILGIEIAQIAKFQTDIEAEYRKSVMDWKQSKENSWNSQKARWGASVKITVEQHPEAASMPVQLSSGQSGQGGHEGFKRESAATAKVREYLEQHPEAASMPVRELADIIGVGKSTVGNYLQSMRLDQNVDVL